MHINHHLWNIYLVPQNDKNLYKGYGQYSLGCCDTSSHSIYINYNLSPYYLKKVLIHEISHATLFSYGLILNEKIEEIISDFMANYGEEIIAITKQCLT